MMVLTGTWLFGSQTAGWWFMFIEAITVFLALIGTTLSCITTGARVTYAMGRDDEVPSHFGLLHGRNLTPHRAIWTLAIISAVIGCFAVLLYLCGPGVPDAMDTALTDAQKHSVWYPSFLLFSKDLAGKLPNSLLIVTLVSNFGTFMLYGLTCLIAIVAFREHKSFSGVKHFLHPRVRVAGQPGVHGVLPGRSVHRVGHEQVGAVHRLGRGGRLGRLWLVVLRQGQQKKGKGILVEKQTLANAPPAAAP